jgi:hypothetical protein
MMSFVPRLSRALLLMLTIPSFAVDIARAQATNPTPYYLPEDGQCTVLIDFQGRRSELGQLDKEGRTLVLAKAMLKEFASNGAEKCPQSDRVRLLAVYIPGTDNYGRPDFGNRTNLVLIEGSMAATTQSAAVDPAARDQLEKLLKVTVY